MLFENKREKNARRKESRVLHKGHVVSYTCAVLFTSIENTPARVRNSLIKPDHYRLRRTSINRRRAYGHRLAAIDCAIRFSPKYLTR
jgi:hypothetical protein